MFNVYNSFYLRKRPLIHRSRQSYSTTTWYIKTESSLDYISLHRIFFDGSQNIRSRIVFIYLDKISAASSDFSPLSLICLDALFNIASNLAEYGAFVLEGGLLALTVLK